MIAPSPNRRLHDEPENIKCSPLQVTKLKNKMRDRLAFTIRSTWTGQKPLWYVRVDDTIIITVYYYKPIYYVLKMFLFCFCLVSLHGVWCKCTV